MADVIGYFPKSNGIRFYAPTITLSVTVQSASFGFCDGTVTVSASGGSGGYVYTITGGVSNYTGIFTGLCEGEYEVTVTDSVGNSGSVIVIVSESIDCSAYKGLPFSSFSGVTFSEVSNCTFNDLAP